MGIHLHAVHLLTKTLPALGSLSDKTLLTFGVQDCYFTYDKVTKFLQRHGILFTPLDPDEVKLTSGFKHLSVSESKQYQQYIHQDTLFRLLGFQQANIHAMDVNQFEGAEIIHDLNVPVGESLRSRFDVIFDGGTIEHVFSPKDSLFNICRMSKVGGLAINLTPCDYINHGFLNFNAEMFRDCYGMNGFNEVCLKYVSRPRVMAHNLQHYLEFSPEVFQCSLQPYYVTDVFSVFRKMEERPLQIPQQGYYKTVWGGEPMAAASSRQGLRKYLVDQTRDLIDHSFLLSAVIRGYRNIGHAKKVSL